MTPSIITYLFLQSDSPGLVNDALIYKIYLKNCIIIKNLSEIKEKNYYLLFLEHIFGYIDKKYLYQSKKNILMVNIDLLWVDNKYLKYIDLFICKTKFTEECLKSLIEKKIIKSTKLLYTNHTTLTWVNDETNTLYDSTIEKNYKHFLHSAGKSPFKNTYLIIKTWMKYKLPPVIITCYNSCLRKLLLNLEITNIDKDELKKYNIYLHTDKMESNEIIYLKNSCGIHLCPSLKEGYGHYINEARIVKSVVVTIDGKPMNEFVDNTSGYLIPVKNQIQSEMNCSIKYSFDINDLYQIINEILNTDETILKNKAEKAYQQYLIDTNFFKNTINKIY